MAGNVPGPHLDHLDRCRECRAIGGHTDSCSWYRGRPAYGRDRSGNPYSGTPGRPLGVSGFHLGTSRSLASPRVYRPGAPTPGGYPPPVTTPGGYPPGAPRAPLPSGYLARATTAGAPNITVAAAQNAPPHVSSSQTELTDGQTNAVVKQADAAARVNCTAVWDSVSKRVAFRCNEKFCNTTSSQISNAQRHRQSHKDGTVKQSRTEFRPLENGFESFARRFRCLKCLNVVSGAGAAEDHRVFCALH